MLSSYPPYNPPLSPLTAFQDVLYLWDDSGKLIPGVTVGEYAMYLKSRGVSGNFTVNGTFYNLHSLLIATPDDVNLDDIVVEADGGYYGNYGVKTK